MCGHARVSSGHQRGIPPSLAVLPQLSAVMNVQGVRVNVKSLIGKLRIQAGNVASVTEKMAFQRVAAFVSLIRQL